MLSPGVRIEAHTSGLERLIVERDACRAELFLHGASLTSWRPRGHEDVLFTSRASLYRADKPIRGGVPICFPWFGPRAGAAQHGFARTSPWRLISTEVDAADAVVLALGLDGDGSRPGFPHRFSARYTVSLGAKLECALEVTNAGETPLSYEDALHAYFAVRDIHAVAVRGLEGAPYLDRVGGGAVPRVSEPEPFGFSGETDRLYLGTVAPIELTDGARRISIAKDGARTSVVWNPWIEKARAMPDLGDEEWTRMVCIEPANALDDAITLAPGAAHTTRMQVVVNGV